MIRRLRKRMVLVCGGAVLAVFLLLFLVICAASCHQLNQAMDGFLDSIADNGGKLPEPDPDTEGRAGPGPWVLFREKARFDIRFFTADFDENGSLLSVDRKADAEISQKEAESCALQIFRQSEDRGWKAGYRYRKYATDTGWTLIFAEGSLNQSVTQMLLFTVGGVMAGTAAVILLLIFLLSRRAVRPAAQAYERQKQFITDANHELKTPLTLIMTNLDIVETECGRSEWIDDIRSEGERMSELINQLILLTRMDETMPGSQDSLFHLSSTVRETLAGFQVLAQENGKQFCAHIEPEVAYYGEQEEICRLLDILLENAVKYCDPQGKIYVSLRGKRHPQIRVENTCRGVKELELDRLFDRFYRGDKARSSSGGFGIGLSIALSIVRNHRGEITAYRKGEDRIGFKVILR